MACLIQAATARLSSSATPGRVVLSVFLFPLVLAIKLELMSCKIMSQYCGILERTIMDLMFSGMGYWKEWR